VLNHLVSGQSNLKLNKQLKADLLRCREKQDSVTQLFKAKEYSLAMLKGQTMHQLYILGREKDSTEELILVNAQLKENLEMLGVDLKSLISTYNRPVLPDYRVLTDPMQKIIKTHLDIGLPPVKAYYDPLPLEEQNEVLRKEINENVYYLNYISSEFNLIEPHKTQLEQLAPKLDSMQIGYQLMRPELLATKKKLEGKLKELRENYVAKGPGGFSEAYKKVFPEVGRTVIVEKRIFEGLESEPEPDMGPGKRQEPVIYEFTDEQAMFPEGNSAMLNYLAKNIRYPKIAIELGIPSSKLYVQFVVSKRGSISNVQVKGGIPGCPECEAEVLRVVRSMPKWIPAKIDGEAVNSWFILPVTICLR
jgi:outer membrane biosynthesis protein TonB